MAKKGSAKKAKAAPKRGGKNKAGKGLQRVEQLLSRQGIEDARGGDRATASPFVF
jgi:hypothetical protein